MYHCSPKVAIRIPLTQSVYLVKKNEVHIPVRQCPFYLRCCTANCALSGPNWSSHTVLLFFSFFKRECSVLARKQTEELLYQFFMEKFSSVDQQKLRNNKRRYDLIWFSLLCKDQAFTISISNEASQLVTISFPKDERALEDRGKIRAYI